MKEATVENRYRLAVKAKGGLCIKLVGVSFTGLPDRIILLPGARIWFCEFKYGNGKLSARQVIVGDMLRRLGFVVLVVDEKNIDEEIKLI